MSNFIEIYENALSDELCDLLVDEFNHQDSIGNTWHGRTGLEIVDEDRVKDSEDFCLIKHYGRLFKEEMTSAVTLNGIPYSDVINEISDVTFSKFLEYNKKYDYHAEWINLNKNNQKAHDVTREKLSERGFKNSINIEYIEDNFKIQPNILLHRYDKKKQGYHVFHADFDDSSPRQIKRSHVVMYYLNDVREGGETEWYYQNLTIKPKKGSLVIWPAYFTHLHKGHIPISNDKYIITMWIEPKFW